MRRRTLPRSRFEFLRVYFGPAVGLLFWLGICVVAWSTLGQSIPERLLKHRSQAPATKTGPPRREDALPTLPANAMSSGDEPHARASTANILPEPPTPDPNPSSQVGTAPPAARPQQTPAEPDARASDTPSSPDEDTSNTQKSQADEGQPGPAAPETSETPETTASAAASAHVVRAQLTSGIRHKEPINQIEGIFHSQGERLQRLYYFTELQGLAGETLTHNWWHNGRLVAKVVFHVRSNSWRAHSSKRLIPSMSGPWKVVMTDSDGKTLSVARFSYQTP